MDGASETSSALASARRKAWVRLLPLLFLCYVIAYIDRTNVSIAKLTMAQDLPGFDNAVFGFGAGIFFIGYFLLEIPGTLLVERWSARKWICRIMVTWGIVAALTALVKTPMHFYIVRFFLGLAEAGFFPGAIVYMTHWFPARDRGRALALYMTGSPIAALISPKISNALLKIGTDETVNGQVIHHPEFLGLEGWQLLYIFWGIPAVVLGVWVLIGLTDRPRDAKWLTAAERDALESELEKERAVVRSSARTTAWAAMMHPKVVLLAIAYFCMITAHYGVEFFMPSVLRDWYALSLNSVTSLMLIPAVVGLAAQLTIGWSSDRANERRLHVAIPILVGGIALAFTPLTRGSLVMTMLCFVIAFSSLKAFLPIFWTLPNLFLTEIAAAGSIGLINSVGNLGGFFGPTVIGKIEAVTGSFAGGLVCMAVTMAISSIILLLIGLGAGVRPHNEHPRRFPEGTPESAGRNNTDC
jgi:MFS transporter, ACS family, tartrate transporter